jgi:hypothetical protein
VEPVAVRAAEAGRTLIVVDFEEVPEPFDATRTMTLGPAAGNVIVGDWTVAAGIPSPGNQSQLVACGEEVSVNVTARPTTIEAGTEKLATGAASAYTGLDASSPGPLSGSHA